MHIRLLNQELTIKNYIVNKITDSKHFITNNYFFKLYKNIYELKRKILADICLNYYQKTTTDFQHLF